MILNQSKQMHITELFNMYLETLGTLYDEEVYCNDRDLHSKGIEGFLEWLKDQPYEIKVIKI
jgi:hypothetical protein